MKKYLYAVLTVFIWSTLAATAKLILNDIPNLQTLAISSFFAFLFLVVINLRGKIVKKLCTYSIKDYGKMAGLGFLGIFAYSALYYYGLTQLTSQEACIVNYLWPIMLVIFSVIILKEKLTFLKIVAMVCSFVGIIVLSLGGASYDGNGFLGIVACVIASACYGLFSVLNKKADYDQNIAMTVIWLTTAICSTVFGLLTEEWVSISFTQLLGLVWMGVVVDAVAYLLWALALKGSENTAKIANLAYMTPFLSLVVSTILCNEKIEFRAVIALVFIVGGILLQSLCDGKKRGENV